MSYPPAVDAPRAPIDGFDRESFLQGPSPFVFTLEDALEVDTLCSAAGVTLTIAGVMLTSDFQIKAFNFQHTPNSNRTLATSRFHIGSGWLLRVRVTASAGTPTFSRVFVWLRTCRGLTSAALTNSTITSGYVTANTDVYWPGNVAQQPLDGEGFLSSVQVSNPAAGADWVATVPTGARWKLTALFATLAAANAGGVRSVRLLIDDGANVLFEVPASATQAINTTASYSYGQGAGGPITADAVVIEAPLANDLYLLAGWRVRTATGAINAADQWSAISLDVTEWISGD